MRAAGLLCRSDGCRRIGVRLRLRHGSYRDVIVVRNQSLQLVVGHQVVTLKPLPETADEEIFVRLFAGDHGIMPGVGRERLAAFGQARQL